MKKVVIISSSMRKGNSDTLCDEFEKGVRFAGNEVTRINLREKNIGYCRACCDCYEIGSCKLRDDMNTLYTSVQEADVLVFATPIYFGGISGQLKTFLDRLYPIYQTLKATSAYVIATCYQDSKPFIDQSIYDIKRFLEDCGNIPLSGIIYGENTDDLFDTTQEQHTSAFQMGKKVN